MVDGLVRAVVTCGSEKKSVCKLSLPEGGLIILFFVFLHHNGWFWYRLHRDKVLSVVNYSGVDENKSQEKMNKVKQSNTAN